MLDGLDDELERPRELAARDEDGRHQAHRVGALAVAHVLDVGVGVRVERRGDGHPLGQVHPGLDLLQHHAVDGLGVGAGQVAEPGGEPRQHSRLAHRMEQLLGAPRATGEDHLVGSDGMPRPPDPGAARLVRHGIPTLTAGGHADDGAHRLDGHAELLGEGEVVLDEGVLGADPAADHAVAALGAAGAVGTGTAEVRVGDAIAGHAVEDTGGSPAEGVLDAHVAGGQPHDLVDDAAAGVGHHAEHRRGQVVVRRELRLPVGDVAPLRVLEERGRRDVQGVGVVERATADPRTGEDHHVREAVDPLYPKAFELGRP